MGISRLIGLNVAQGLDKADRFVKEAKLKLVNGKMAKVEKHTESLVLKNKSTEKANAQWLVLSGKREDLTFGLSNLNENINLRKSEKINLRKSVIKEAKKSLVDAFSKTAMKIEIKTDLVKQYKIQEDTRRLDAKIKGCDDVINSAKPERKSADPVRRAKSDKMNLMAEKLTINNSEYQVLSLSLEKEKEKLKSYQDKEAAYSNEATALAKDLADLQPEYDTPEYGKKEMTVVGKQVQLEDNQMENISNITKTTGKISEISKQLESIEHSLKRAAYKEVYPEVTSSLETAGKELEQLQGKGREFSDRATELNQKLKDAVDDGEKEPIKDAITQLSKDQLENITRIGTLRKEIQGLENKLQTLEAP